MIQTKPKTTRTAVFRDPACCTNQLSRETWIDAIDVSPRRQPVRPYSRAWHIQNLLAEAGPGSQLCCLAFAGGSVPAAGDLEARLKGWNPPTGVSRSGVHVPVELVRR